MMELSQARLKLQAAIDESHPAPPAKYLRASAAACLLYGLQLVPSGFRMNAVLCTQVTSHVQAECPDKPDVMQRLQNSRYFEVIGLPGLPDQFLLDLHAIIMPHQLPQVTDILASINPIHPQPHQPPQTKTSPDQPEPTQLTVPSQGVEAAKVLLQTAVSRSHGSHTATWLRETAAACMDIGLKASVSGLQMRPVKYQLLATRMQGLLQGANELLIKLQSIAGQKYFTLLGPIQNPLAVSLDLSSIIHPPGRSADVDRLLSSIKAITEHQSSTNDSKPPPGYPASTQSCTNDSMLNLGAMDVVGVRKQLKAAILKSHPPTARYLVEAAAICLDYGLQAAPSQGCILKPVAWGLVIKAVTSMCPGTYDLADKLCGSVGQKYFRLLGTSPAGWPELVAAKLDSLITSTQLPPVAQLLACVAGAASSTHLHQSSMPSQDLADASMTESTAKQMLRAAIQTEHAGTQESAKFIRAMGCAVVELGLRTRGSSGFQLAPVTFTSVGQAIVAVKKNSPLATRHITAIIAELHLQHYFSYAADAISEKHLTMHVAHVLPHADATIQSLLPDVMWKDRGPSPSAADNILSIPVQKGQAQTPAATQKQSTIPATQSVGIPSAPHTPTGLDKPPTAEQQADHTSSTPPFMVKIWGMSAVALICIYEECSTSAADLLSSVHVRSVEGCCTFDMKQQQVELEMQGFHTLLHNNKVVKVLHDCRQAAAALFYQKNIIICNVFDTQVAQGVLDHTSSVLGTLQYQHRRNLKDLLSLYNITAPHPGMSQGVEAAARDSADLLLLAKELNGLLGTSGQAIAYKLSQAQCQWNYLPADRCSTQPKHPPNPQQQPLQLNQAKQEKYEDGHPGKPDSDASQHDSGSNKFLLTSGACIVPVAMTASTAISSQLQALAAKVDLPAAEADADSDTMQSILSVLPEEVRDAVLEHLQSRSVSPAKLAEIVAVEGKPVTLWFTDQNAQELPVHLDIALAVTKLSKAASCGDTAESDPFNAENRMGLDGTLHRISAIRGRHQQQSITCLTYRIGWHISGIADQLLDTLAELQPDCSGKVEGACPSSLLLLGPPGAGKTTLLRDIVSNLATRFDKRVVVVDTWNEVGGDGAKPHACLGTARRLCVPDHSMQYKVMLQAMQIFNPQVIVVDEISSLEEVQAIFSIVQHGAIVVASAAEPSLKSLTGNPELNALVGRLHPVACGDMHTKDPGNTLSMRRQGVPLFKVLVEVLTHDKWRVHQNIAVSMDALLAGRQPDTQPRPHKNGKLVIHFDKAAATMPDSNFQETDPFWLMRLGKLANQNEDAASLLCSTPAD